MQGKTKSKYIFMILIGAFVLLLLSIFLASCAGNQPIAQQSGAQLWGDNCVRCHNIRPPANLTDEQWEVAVMHMRTRANLTAVEAEKILEFLKAGN